MVQPRTLRALILTIVAFSAFSRPLFAAAAAAPTSVSPAQSGVAAQSGAVAQDTKLGRVYIALPVGNSVLVLSTSNMSMKAVLHVPPTPSAIALDPDLHRIYVASDVSGEISVFDSRSYRLLQQRTIGGHPAGLALSNYGKVLIITDGRTGAVLRMPVVPRLAAPIRATSVGLNAPVLVVQPTLSAGSTSLIWARGFLPHESINVYWGVKFSQQIMADGAGFVSAKIAVPKGSDLGLHLLVLIGQTSTRSQSTLITVVHAPPPPVKPRPVPVKHSWKDTVARLLKPHIAFAVPPFIAVGPLKSLKQVKPSGGVPVIPVLALLVLAASVLLVHAGRQRRKHIRATPPTSRQVPAGNTVPSGRSVQPGASSNLRRAS